jgi:hypothetical protein
MTGTLSEILTLRGALVRALLLLEGQRATKRNRERAILTLNAALRIVQNASEAHQREVA